MADSSLVSVGIQLAEDTPGVVGRPAIVVVGRVEEPVEELHRFVAGSFGSRAERDRTFAQVAAIQIAGMVVVAELVLYSPVGVDSE